MARGSTQPLTEMSTRSISLGKGGRCVRLTTYHHAVSLSRNLGASGPFQACTFIIYLCYDCYILTELLPYTGKQLPKFRRILVNFWGSISPKCLGLFGPEAEGTMIPEDKILCYCFSTGALLFWCFASSWIGVRDTDRTTVLYLRILPT